jgi:lipopolysaccharide/colanic/teichoic acid biosynthesis glycosyltransferase
VDLKYIRERSLWNDFKIILKTICLMLEKRGH